MCCYIQNKIRFAKCSVHCTVQRRKGDICQAREILKENNSSKYLLSKVYTCARDVELNLPGKVRSSQKKLVAERQLLFTENKQNIIRPNIRQGEMFFFYITYYRRQG